MMSSPNTLSPPHSDVSAGASTNNGGPPSMAGDFQEIDFAEIEMQNVVGRGTYGVVKKGIWRGKTVAVKVIEGETARKAFLVEVYQLSRVKHKNIINLYGACVQNPVCVVMEYAECGSLHKVLHCPPKPAYKVAHAFSWMLQCAEGVEYLHSFQPKPLVHRDLKPLNLLLIDHGRRLKICDFGTACNLQTNMTNNKGSAQWMAPEVFEGSKYSEKCDLFSWGIMLWEVLTRRKPFQEVGGSAYSVMWAVHSGQRPPLIQNCPKPIELLMTRCWSKSPNDRPAMSEVVKIMSRLMDFFKGADEPLDLENHECGDEDDSEGYSLTGITMSGITTAGADNDFVFTLPAMPACVKNVRSVDAQQTAPASLTGSEGDLLLTLQRSLVDDNVSNTGVRGHRRAGSYDMGANAKGSAKAVTATVSVDNAPRRESSSGTLGNRKTTLPALRLNVPDAAARPERSAFSSDDSLLATSCSSDDASDVPLAFLALDAQFQPLPPFPGSNESKEIYREHCRLAEGYIKIQEEIGLMLKTKEDLITELNNNIKEAHQTSRYQEYQQLLREKEQMEDLHRTLKADLENARKQRLA